MNKESIIKRIGLTLMILGFLSAIAIGHNYVQNNNKTMIEQAELINLTITVGDKVKNIEAKNGLSLMEVMKENYQIQTQYNGTFIIGIDDTIGDDSNFIAFYINGEMAMVGACDYIPVNKDSIEFKLEEIKF